MLSRFQDLQDACIEPNVFPRTAARELFGEKGWLADPQNFPGGHNAEECAILGPRVRRPAHDIARDIAPLSLGEIRGVHSELRTDDTRGNQGGDSEGTQKDFWGMTEGTKRRIPSLPRRRQRSAISKEKTARQTLGDNGAGTVVFCGDHALTACQVNLVWLFHIHECVCAHSEGFDNRKVRTHVMLLRRGDIIFISFLNSFDKEVTQYW